MSTLSVRTQSVEETVALGQVLGELLAPGDVVALVGPLGAGKTYFTKGIALGLGVAGSPPVVSPSFVLVREHLGRCRLRHVDAYRLRHPRELIELGAEELFDEAGVTVVEWADRFPEGTVPVTLEVRLSHVGAADRDIVLRGRSRRGEELSDALRRALAARTRH